MAKLSFLGGAGGTVSGSNYLLEVDGKKFLIDCGLFQGSKKLEELNYESLAFDASEIDFVLITHAHLDHIGRLPALLKGGFRGKIFATPPTIEFTRLMLEDSCKLLKEKAKHADVLPFFGESDIDEIMKFFSAVDYHNKTSVDQNISFEFFEAGHILGSAFIKLDFKEKGKERIIVFSGDLGNRHVSILRPLETLSQADYILIESAYGDRLHEEKKEAKDVIEDTVEDTIAKKGVLMIPSFAMERTQQILFHLNELVENKRIPSVPIFIDSPLASEVTKIYERYNCYFNDEAKNLIRFGDDIFKFPGLKFTPNIKESKEINNIQPPKIIIAGSGMSQGGRIVHHEERYLPDAKNTLLIVTFQAEGTLGRQLQDGAKEVEIFDRRVAVRAKIKSISSYSAHADQAELLEWLDHFKKPIKKVFVVQGEQKPAAALAQIIKDQLGIMAEVPAAREVADLD